MQFDIRIVWICQHSFWTPLGVGAVVACARALPVPSVPNPTFAFPPAVYCRCWNILPTAYICLSPGHRHVPEPALASRGAELLHLYLLHQPGLMVLLVLLWGCHGMWPLSGLFPDWIYFYEVMASAFSAEQCWNLLCPVLPSPALLLSASFTCQVLYFYFFLLAFKKA